MVVLELVCLLGLFFWLGWLFVLYIWLVGAWRCFKLMVSYWYLNSVVFIALLVFGFCMFVSTCLLFCLIARFDCLVVYVCLLFCLMSFNSVDLICSFVLYWFNGWRLVCVCALLDVPICGLRADVFASLNILIMFGCFVA